VQPAHQTCFSVQEPQMKKAFDHIGIPTTEPHPDESWVPFSSVWVTNPEAPAADQYIRQGRRRASRWDCGSCGTGRTSPTAWTICAPAVGKELIYGPFDPGGFGDVAFVLEDGVVIEYMESAT
jgi:hypothetical protein